MLKRALPLVLGATGIFVACGDETTIVEGGSIAMVADADALGDCDGDNEGELLWLKSEAQLRMCSGGEWLSMNGSVDTLYIADSKCSTEPLKDSSGVKIICNGDSVGVVLNGRDGADGKNGKDGIDGVDGKDLIDTTVSDSESVPTELNTISGCSQKGPFLSGTPVTVRGLENGRTLTQSNITYTGFIANDKGEFKLRGGMLKSQYVSLSATGYYKNEMTGGNSDGQISLNALTDLSTHTTANLNLLTHLEYDRVYYLVQNEGKRVAAAKKQAQKEIFAAFHIDSDGFKNSEDMNIAGSSEADAALLAVSIIMQNRFTTSEFSEYLSKFAADLETDGKGNNGDSSRVAVADAILESEFGWFRDDDNSCFDPPKNFFRLADVRTNVKGWNLSQNEIPNFEKYVRHFWSQELGLGVCGALADGLIKDDSLPVAKDGEIRYVTRPGSLYRVMDYEDSIPYRYICHADSNRWVEASDVEKNTYGESCAAGDNKVIKGKLDKRNSYYCKDSAWVNITEWDWNIPKEARFNPDIEYGSMTDNRDQKTYRTVEIGNQTWMAENLNYADSSKTPSLVGNSRCYNDSLEYCKVGGRLYTWDAAIDICPEGWHLPDSTEWAELLDLLKVTFENEDPSDMPNYGTAASLNAVGSAAVSWLLKSSNGWNNSYTPGICSSRLSSWGSGCDRFGFTALPVGAYYDDLLAYPDHFRGAGSHTAFWSSSEAETEKAYIFSFSKDSLSQSKKKDALSVRCVQD